MSEHFASGMWIVRDGAAEEFIARWRDFLAWTRDHQSGLESATLVRSDAEPNRFVSFATWASPGDRDIWKQSEGFMPRFSACRQLCDDFVGGDYRQVVQV